MSNVESPTREANGSVVSREIKDNNPSVQLFQRAHQKMVMLQRIDDQVQQLMNQRRSMQDELRGIQAQINDEFDKLLTTGKQQPSRMLNDFADEVKRNGKKRNGTHAAEPADEVELTD